MTARIVYLATADARGHLMRAQLLTHALRRAGAHVQVLTTSDAGQRFLAGFGLESSVLSRHYAVQFDDRQNMQRGATNRNVAQYVFHPGRMWRDILSLRAHLRPADLLVNDSFHPAALFMGSVPGWRRKVVHVYGGSLKAALLGNFDGMLPRAVSRAFAGIVDWQIDAARARFEHDFAYGLPDGLLDEPCRLPTPVPVADIAPATPPADAAVYLNPHFRDRSLAQALCAGIADMGLRPHLVGEGYAGQEQWQAVDADWVSRAAHASVIVSAPGMAALSIALVYQRPIVLVLTDQPEQALNARRATQWPVKLRTVTWRGDGEDFRLQVSSAIAELYNPRQPAPDVACGREAAQHRIDAWTQRILALCH